MTWSSGTDVREPVLFAIKRTRFVEATVCTARFVGDIIAYFWKPVASVY